MRILTIGAVALALGGCGDKDAVDCVADPTNPACPQTGTGGGTDTTPTSDPGPSCDEVSAFSFSLDYAWDDTAAATTSFSIDGSSSPSVFVIEYGNAAGGYCEIANAAGFMLVRKNLDLDAWAIPCWQP